MTGNTKSFANGTGGNVKKSPAGTRDGSGMTTYKKGGSKQLKDTHRTKSKERYTSGSKY